MRNTWCFYTASEITFGPGAVNQIGKRLAQRSFGRVLIVTDPVLEELEIAERVRASVQAAGIEVETFDEGEPEPSLTAALRAVEHARQFKPDAIIGLGGGSNMDMAKMAATIYTHGGQPSDYFSFDNVPGPIVPLICIPTTAGTGSEVSRAMVLTDTENKMKVSSLSNYIRPQLALVDPELTYSCPAKVAADSGIDALTHAIEGITATNFFDLDVAPGELTAYEGSNPLGDCIGEKAIEIIGENLRPAVNDPEHTEARDKMALAATLAGIAFSNNGVAVVHALEYPLGGELHCSHGAGNGLLLPFVMKFNLPQRRAKFARIAKLLGEDVQGLDEEAAAQKAIDAIVQLKKDIGIPERIRDLGGKEAQLPGFAEKSFQIKRLMDLNPRTPTQADLLAMLQDAF